MFVVAGVGGVVCGCCQLFRSGTVVAQTIIDHTLTAATRSWDHLFGCSFVVVVLFVVRVIKKR